MRVTKEQLLAFVNTLQTDSVEVEFDHDAPMGGGQSTPGRWVIGYGLKISVCEEAPDGVTSGFKILGL